MNKLCDMYMFCLKFGLFRQICLSHIFYMNKLHILILQSDLICAVIFHYILYTTHFKVILMHFVHIFFLLNNEMLASFQDSNVRMKERCGCKKTKHMILKRLLLSPPYEFLARPMQFGL
jgi:hypothetical protein